MGELILPKRFSKARQQSIREIDAIEKAKETYEDIQNHRAKEAEIDATRAAVMAWLRGAIGEHLKHNDPQWILNVWKAMSHAHQKNPQKMNKAIISWMRDLIHRFDSI